MKGGGCAEVDGDAVQAQECYVWVGFGGSGRRCGVEGAAGLME